MFNTLKYLGLHNWNFITFDFAWGIGPPFFLRELRIDSSWRWYHHLTRRFCMAVKNTHSIEQTQFWQTRPRNGLKEVTGKAGKPVPALWISFNGTVPKQYEQCASPKRGSNLFSQLFTTCQSETGNLKNFIKMTATISSYHLFQYLKNSDQVQCLTYKEILKNQIKHYTVNILV